MSSNGQNNHNSKISADQVWLSLLEDLKQTPLEIPETWPKETSAIWDSEELALVVMVPGDTDQEWMERRFLPLAKIYFEEAYTEKQLVLQRKGREGQDDLLVRIQSTAYEEIIEPNKIVPVQIYMFHHWLPVLGAPLFWVVTAMRQVSFIAKTEESSVLKPISTRVLAKWSPLKFRQVARWLKKEGFSSWFFKKVKDSYEDVAPEYAVWSQVPVAPHHLSWIEDYFKKHTGEKSAVVILESLIDRTREIRRVKPGEMKLPSFYRNKRRTVISLVSKYFPGKISQEVSDLVTQLEHLITRPNLAITIPHYFFHKYMGELNSNEVALIWYLRSLYKEDESNKVQFNGSAEISAALGCGYNTSTRLIEKCVSSQEDNGTGSWDPNYLVSLSLGNWLLVDFLNECKNGTAREYTIKVRSTEPIHQDDKGYYDRLLKQKIDDIGSNNESPTKPSQNDTGPDIIPSQKDTGSDTTPSQNDLEPTQNDTVPSHNDTGASQKDTGYLSKTTHYNSFNTNESLTNSFNDSLIPPQPSLFDPDLSTYIPVVGVKEIDLEKLLGFGSYKHTEKKKLVELIEKNQEQFLAWFIRNHITAAKFPVRLAVKNVKEGNSTEDQYLELAALGWGITAQLVSVNENDLSMWELGLDDDYEDQEDLIQVYKKLSKPAKKEIKKLSDTEYSQVVENIWHERKGTH